MKINTSLLDNVLVLPDGIQAACPICQLQNEDKKGRNHLKIFKNGAFNCVKYGKDKDHNKAIKKFLLSGDGNIDFSESVFIDPAPKLENEKIYPEEMLSRLIKNHSYWENRKVKHEVVTKFNGGLAPQDEKNKLSGRYIFPIRNENEQIIGFSGRLVYENSLAPKWKHLFRVKSAIFPNSLAERYIKESRTVILLESIGDYLSLANYDIWNSLVIFGLNINSKLISFLVKTDVNKIIISTNNDISKDNSQAGNKAAIKLKEKLCSYFNEDQVIIRLPEKANDWGEAGEEEILKFKKEIE